MHPYTYARAQRAAGGGALQRTSWLTPARLTRRRQPACPLKRAASGGALRAGVCVGMYVYSSTAPVADHFLIQVMSTFPARFLHSFRFLIFVVSLSILFICFHQSILSSFRF